MDWEEIKETLKKNMTPSRFQHTMGVVQASEKLTAKTGISQKKAKLAALLHDCAKGLEREELLALIEKSRWHLDKTELLLTPVLHAPAGAYLAECKWGVKDMGILEAIRYHTIGSPDMGRLAQIIYIADMIESGRDFPGINEIRSLAKKDLYSAIITICNYSIKYNIEKERIIHPHTLLLRNKFIENTLLEGEVRC